MMETLIFIVIVVICLLQWSDAFEVKEKRIDSFRKDEGFHRNKWKYYERKME